MPSLKCKSWKNVNQNTEQWLPEAGEGEGEKDGGGMDYKHQNIVREQENISTVIQQSRMTVVFFKRVCYLYFLCK